ncbi:hypothetical protein KNU13_gp83 [Gordonia phage Turuncu]|uniref:Uncharacterized protein n=1 Tax=Gordonia phage Turuncu TaxID=2315610 RepID=A0A386KAF3_9CAUD|nr:hypothetical protein KNU13_gp83 [Gordonia phage Turuncu]AYD82169.1 hypothetical protein SEA_TURUNCU_83 [Gordonia phage Turuncu]
MSYRKVYAPDDADMLTEALDRLREILPPGSTVVTIVKHVTASGMGRTIQPVTVYNGAVFDLTGYVARVVGWKVDTDRGGVYVQGCGMDMGFHLVYTLARTIYGHLTPEQIRDTRPGDKLPHPWESTTDAGYLLTHRGI